MNDHQAEDQREKDTLSKDCTCIDPCDCPYKIDVKLDGNHHYFRDLIWSQEYKLLEDYYKFSFGIIGASWAIISSKYFPNPSFLFFLSILLSMAIIVICFFRRGWDISHMRTRYEVAIETDEDVDLTEPNYDSKKMNFWGVVCKWLLVFTFIIFTAAPIRSYYMIEINHEKVKATYAPPVNQVINESGKIIEKTPVNQNNHIEKGNNKEENKKP